MTTTRGITSFGRDVYKFGTFHTGRSGSSDAKIIGPWGAPPVASLEREVKRRESTSLVTKQGDGVHDSI